MLNGSSGTVTNVTIEYCHFEGNALGAPQMAGNGNLTIYEFNAKATLKGITVDATGADYGIQISSGWETDRAPLESIVIEDVEIMGAPLNYGLIISRYIDINDSSIISFNGLKIDVDLAEGNSFYGFARAALLFQELFGSATIDLGNTVLAGDRGSGSQDLIAPALNVNATGAAFSSSDNFEIEDHVYHRLDNPNHGLVTWVANNVYVTPNSGSIQRGINAAGSGWTVNVAPGTFNEDLSIHINKPNLTLAGANAGIPAGVNPGERGPESVIVGKIEFRTGGQAEGMTIDGFAINCAGGDAVNYRATGITTFVNNIIECNGTVDHGIFNIKNGTPHFIIKDNTITGNFKMGIRLQSNNNAFAEISGNVITGSSASGTAVGIRVDDPVQATIENNHISNNGYALALASSAQCTVENNTVENNNVGVYLSGSNIELTGNAIRNNSTGIYGETTNNNNTIAHNRIYNNSYGALNYGGVLNAAFNWWGVSDQAAIAALLGGSGVIDYVPWWANEEMTLRSDVAAVNAASKTEMRSVLEANAVALELDMSEYNSLPDESKTQVGYAVYDARPSGGFADAQAVREAFNQAVKERVLINAVNAPNTVGDMYNALVTNAEGLGIDVSDLITWTQHYKDKVAGYVLNERPALGYSTLEEIRNAYASILAYDGDGVVGTSVADEAGAVNAVNAAPDEAAMLAALEANGIKLGLDMD